MGPDARGNIPSESLDRLEQIGKWMKLNGESIYGCSAANLPKPENGRLTRNGNTIYYHIYENSIGSIWLENIKHDEIKSIRLLCDGTEIKLADNWMVENYPDAVFVDVSSTVYLPDSVDTVLKIKLKEEK